MINNLDAAHVSTINNFLENGSQTVRLENGEQFTVKYGTPHEIIPGPLF